MNDSRRLPATAMALLLMSLPVCGQAVAVGTRLPVQLLTELSSKHSKAGDPVRCVLVASVPSDAQPLLPAGLEIAGSVALVEQVRNRPARLRVDFQRIQRPAGNAVPLAAKLRNVDNARETVAGDGTIVGLSPIHVRPSKKEDVLMAALYAHPLMLASFEAARLLRREMEDPTIHFPAKVEMTLELTAALDARALAGGPVLRNQGAAEDPVRFSQLVAAQPLRTKAGGRWSDQTNLLFAGTLDELDGAFTAAGWSRARDRGVRSDLKTFLAMFDQREYSAAPVSLLTLDGKPPDRVYEKQTNTFSQRHHVRIWLRPELHEGKPVWLAAATHDIGILYSRKSRSFAHRVEPNVDLERTVILNDLRFVGATASFALVPRAKAEREFENATGDHLVSDGQVAVIVLRASGPKP